MSWRVWLLIWLLPVAFALTAVGLAGWTGLKYLTYQKTTGAVVRVFMHEGETVFDRGVANFAPVFRYEFAPGEMTEASTGMSAPEWNFDINSRHPIRFDPRRKGDVMLEGAHNWSVAGVIGLIALVTAVPALWAHRRVRRWQQAGRGLA